MVTESDFQDYKRLASAIVRQAMEDYADALRYSKKVRTGEAFKALYLILADGINKKNNLKRFKMTLTKIKNKIIKMESEIYSCEEFFYSDWFAVLSEANPDYIVDKINKLVEQETA